MSPRAHVLVIDDEAAIRRLVHGALDRAGHQVSEAGNAADALAIVNAPRPPDLALLDLGLPDRDGMELVPLLKRAGLAVLILSARDATAEKVAALDLGADDYVTKPFDTEELLARVRASLRHRLTAAGEPEKVRAGAVEIDLAARLIRRDGEEVRLTPKEYGLLSELARHPGRVLTHAQLLRAVWGPAHEHDVEYLRVTTRSLRLKLEEDPAAPLLVRNEPGVGYRLMADQG